MRTTRHLLALGAVGFLLAAMWVCTPISPATASPAGGSHGGEVTVNTSVCGRLTLDFVATGDHSAHFKYREDGGPAEHLKVTPETGYATVVFGPYEEDTTHVVSYRVGRHGEWIDVAVDTDCETPEPTAVTPAGPEVDCVNGQTTATIPDEAGVTYLVDGEPLAPDTYLVEPGEYEVVAEAAEGYVFPDGAVTSWDVTGGPCEGGSTTSTSTPSPTMGGTPVTSTSVPTVTSTTVAASSSGTLPRTGSTVVPILMIGGGLVLIGAGILAARRLRALT